MSPARLGVFTSCVLLEVVGANLIRVAVTRDISQAVPIAGSFAGTPETYLGMTVEVAVAAEARGRAKVASRA